MKNRILTFIIGVLVGAIFSTTGCFLYSKTIKKNQSEMMKSFENNGRMQRPNGNMGEPPTKPEGDFRQKIHNNI